jgi:protein-tyrosine phosphatase
VVKRWLRRITRRRPIPNVPRQVRFDGMVNFRDLGGLPVEGGTIRPGVLYRSDSLAYATDADAERLVGALKLATIIDLRGEYEVSRLGRGPLIGRPVIYVSAPIADVTGAEELSRHYLAMLEEKGEVLAAMVRLLGGPGALPAVFHCEAGCDRTGVLAAVVLSLLGVDEDEIAADYALTAAAMPAIHARVAKIVEQLGLPPRVVVDWVPEAHMMADTLKLAREKWGGMHEWGHAHGLTDADIEALRKALVTQS